MSLTLADLAAKSLQTIAGERWPILHRAGVRTAAELITQVPFNRPGSWAPTPIRDLVAGDPTPRLVIGRLVKHWGAGMLVGATIRDRNGDTCTVNWFGQTWRIWQLVDGHQVRMIATPTIADARKFDMPAAFECSPAAGRVIYPLGLRKGLTSDVVREMAERALAVWERHGIEDVMTAEFLERHGLVDRATAFRHIHRAPDEAAFDQARRRLAFDELLWMQLTLARRRTQRMLRDDGTAHDSPVAEAAVAAFIAGLPYPLTGAQQRVVAEIGVSMAAAAPMNRLLQGDVGAGKTQMAAAAAVRATACGTQVAVLAPTQVLADQLHTEMTKSLGATVRCERFPSKAGKARKEMVARIAAGDTEVVVGTTALLEPTVNFARLGLVVVDEQHRFGVRQREVLRRKMDESTPDVLAMTATPIPRTAAMTVLGEMEVSTLDEMPPGRVPVATHWATDENAVWPHIRREVAAGRQAFVVCPLVDDDGENAAQSATDLHMRLSETVFPEMRVGLLHGQMHADDKAETMRLMRAGDIDVLVATTVIEVGVDVPNASIIAIYADRFGIAQLHQLRGRVGRGGGEAWCWLLAPAVRGTHGKMCPPRVQALLDSNDGFVLAEADWAMRGEGTVYGTTQSGVSDLQAVSLRTDGDLCELARTTAIKLIGNDPTLASKPAVAAEVAAFVPDEAAAMLSAS